MGETQSRTDSLGIILAAGNGSRMRSRLPKPLHQVAGKELIRYSVELMTRCGIGNIVVVASPNNLDSIAAALGEGVEYAVQPTPNGTADAVSCGLSALDQAPDMVMVMAADTPLVRERSIRQLMNEHESGTNRRMTILTANDAFLPDLGRVQRSISGDTRLPGPVSAIVEARDLDCAASPHQPEEVNTGVYCFDGQWLAEKVAQAPRSESGEFYLTSLAAMAASLGDEVVAAPFAYADEAIGGKRPPAVGRGFGGPAGPNQFPLDAGGRHHHR